MIHLHVIGEDQRSIVLRNHIQSTAERRYPIRLGRVPAADGVRMDQIEELDATSIQTGSGRLAAIPPVADLHERPVDRRTAAARRPHRLVAQHRRTDHELRVAGHRMEEHQPIARVLL